MPKKNKRSRRKKNTLTAKTADKHDLYQRSVQDPPIDIVFIDRVFKKEHERRPKSLREDFCGTALLCAEWVRQKKEGHAIGVDLHQPTLNWGYRRNIKPLGEAADRVTLAQANVLDGDQPKVDVAVAFNFSYCVFKTRPELVDYFRAARKGLKSGGAFFLDIHGGLEAGEELEESTRHKGFTYVWDQEPYDAVNGLGKRYIHFRFSDGSEIKRAFVYDWRIWTLPELKECLDDAGFSRVDVYWEGADEDGDGNGVFRRVTRAEEEQSWIAYVVGWR